MITKELADQLTAFIGKHAQEIINEHGGKPDLAYLSEFRERLNKLRPDIREAINVTSNDAQLAIDKTIEFFEVVARGKN